MFDRFIFSLLSLLHAASWLLVPVCFLASYGYAINADITGAVHLLVMMAFFLLLAPLLGKIIRDEENHQIYH